MKRSHRFGTTFALALVLCGAYPMPDRAAEPAEPRPPAPSLRSPTSPASPVDSAGFVRRWLVLEPVSVGNRLTADDVEKTLQDRPYPEQSSVMPRDGEVAAWAGAGQRWHAVDTLGYNVNLYHFAWALARPTSNVLFWAVTIVDSPRDMQDVRLAIGSNAASVWWINGERVIALYNDRQSVIDDGVSRRVTLRKGPNVIRAAIVNAGGATDFCARFLDAEDRPITGLTARLAVAPAGPSK